MDEKEGIEIDDKEGREKEEKEGMEGRVPRPRPGPGPKSFAASVGPAVAESA